MISEEQKRLALKSKRAKHKIHKRDSLAAESPLATRAKGKFEQLILSLPYAPLILQMETQEAIDLIGQHTLEQDLK